jgi:hypothetical protein
MEEKKEWRGEGEDKEPVIDLYTTTPYMTINLFTHFSPFCGSVLSSPQN